jgi:Trp operon repressor
MTLIQMNPGQEQGEEAEWQFIMANLIAVMKHYNHEQTLCLMVEVNQQRDLQNRLDIINSSSSENKENNTKLIFWGHYAFQRKVQMDRIT